jgi:hypothetical protein
MPITDIDSYVSTADAFIEHWTDVDADRVANTLPPITLQGTFDLAGFQADRDALQAAITGLAGFENALTVAASNRDSTKDSLLERLRQFRSAGDLHLKGSSYYGSIPTLPNSGASESKFLRPFDDVANLWATINADMNIPGLTPPLLLRAGYAVATFNTDLAGVRTVYRTVRDAENNHDVARRKRDVMLEPLKERMLQYRSAIELEYAEGHPFRDTLPDLWPSPGSTPDAVTLSGQWNSSPGSGLLTWNESTNPNLDHYLVRFSPERRTTRGTRRSAGICHPARPLTRPSTASPAPATPRRSKCSSS